jgi:hypothetical protein
MANDMMRTIKIAVITVHAIVGWMLCGATIGIGKAVTSMQITLIAHAIAAPVIFGIIAFIYHKKLSYTSPFQTALIFVFAVIILDAGLVAPVFKKSYEMFRSVLGTWIPLVLMLNQRI